MIAKVIFTALVIMLIGAIFRSKATVKQRSGTPDRASVPTDDNQTQSLTPKQLAYLIIAVLLLASMVVFYINWSHDNQIITLKVVNTNGEATEYAAYRKHIKSRRFTSTDGRLIELADSDRIEWMTAP